MKSILISSLIVLLIFGALLQNESVHAAPGRDFYVAAGGRNSNPGTLEQPWRTVQHAVDNVGPGDTIYLRAGTYNESVQIHQSGGAGNSITLSNYGNEAVTINGGSSPAISDTTGTQYWVISGLTLDSSAEFTVLFNFWGCSGTCQGTHHWEIRDNRIVGAVRIYGTYNLLEGNEVDGSQHKGSEDGVWELFDASHHNTFRNNHIHHFSSRGIWSMHRTHDSVFADNYIHDIGTGSDGMCINTDGFGTVEWRHVITGNRLHNCGWAAIQLENTYDSVVENNTIYDAGTIGIHIINYGRNFGPGSDKCQVGGENNQYGDTDGNNDCEGDRTDNIIRQNLIYGTAQQGAISIRHVGGISIWGNTIYNTGRWGIYLEGDVKFTPEISIRSNILVENGDAEIFFSDPASLVQDDHNLFHHTGAGHVYVIPTVWTYYSLAEYQAATGKGEGSLQADPQFLSTANSNFRLQDSSPAIDTGISIGSSSDLDGNPRPQGDGIDMGAYEASTS